MFTDGGYFLQASQQMDRFVAIEMRGFGLQGFMKQLDIDEAGSSR